METFMPRVSAAVATPDPSKHVKYTHGMLLGADDFTQEFAYLSERDQWLARDLIGYGTVSGLQVRKEKDDKGPRVLITPGVALSPRGQLIRVAPAQCAYLNQWLAANKEKLSEHTTHKESPPSDWVRLYVVLCYRDCATEMTPVPGEPCRSEDELMAASRLVDDFHLELRFEAPDQQEEVALNKFVGWLRQVEISEAGTTTRDEFRAAIRDSAHLLPLDSPPNSTLEDFMSGSPPSNLNIPAGRVCEYLSAAFRVWVTELRPLWRPNWFREWQCCDPKVPVDETAREECLLLAELEVPVHSVLSGETRVDDVLEIDINEDRRPILVHQRLLQEWLLCGRASQNTIPEGDMAVPGGELAAAGTFDLAGGTVFSFGGIKAERNEDTTVYLLSGDWFSAKAHYVVRGTPLGDLANKSGLTFEVISPGVGRQKGIMVRVTGAKGTTINGFSVEITRYPLRET